MPAIDLPADIERERNTGKISLGGTGIATPPSPRLVSLDAFRGFIMFWIVGGGSLVVGLQALDSNFLVDTVIYQLKHSAWEGLRFYDCIWPSFMLMTGMSIAFSFAKRSKTQTYRQMFFHALRRTAILFLLGSLRESVHLGSPFLIELSSALQPIAIASFLAFLLARKSPRFQAATAASIWGGYALLLAFVPAPGIAAGTYELNHNLVNYVDVALLPNHWAQWPSANQGWGTILSTIPTISTTIVGLMLGGVLRGNRSGTSKMKIIGGVGVSGLILGYAMSPVVPVVMKMWTTSYGILSAAWACLMFLVFYWVIDVGGRRRWAFFFVVIGMNALAIYLSSTVTRLPQIIGVLAKPGMAALGAYGLLFKAVLVLALKWIILFWMYRRKIFLGA